MGIDWGAFAAAGVGAGAGLWEGWRNREFQRETNEHNEALMRESWARDDTAIQRQAADMEAAGLSKTLAAGGGAANSGPIRLEAPKASHGVVDSAMQAAQSVKSIAQTEAATEVTRQVGRKAKAEADMAVIDAEIKKDVHDTREDVVAAFAKVRRELGLKDEQDVKLAMMYDEQKLSAAKNIHYEEFARLELRLKRANASASEQKTQQLKLANALLAKDLQWYNVNAVGKVVGAATGAARNVVPYIPFIAQ